jgi:hypothetical protein
MYVYAFLWLHISILMYVRVVMCEYVMVNILVYLYW